MKRMCLSCRRLIDRGSRCVECQRAEWRRKKRLRPAYERSLYGSAAWRRLSLAVTRAAGACHWCGAIGVQLTADHITPVRADPYLALEPGNVVAACRSCQERRKVRPAR